MENYSKREILAAFKKWLSECSEEPSTDPQECADILCGLMDAARQPEPI